jgi:hypothetical protein
LVFPTITYTACSPESDKSNVTQMVYFLVYKWDEFAKNPPTSLVEVPKSNTTIIWTPLFEWYVVRCGSQNKHQRDMCFKEIGLNVEIEATTLGTIVNMIGGIYLESSHWGLRCPYELQKLWFIWLQTQFGFVNHLAPNVCFIICEIWV